MATYTFNEFTISIVISSGTEGVPLSYEVNFGEIYTSGVITRKEDGLKWNVIKGGPLPQIQLVKGRNEFSIEFDDNKEVILTEKAVKQLIKNIQDADNNIKNDYIPKSTFSGAFDIMYSSEANTPAVLTAHTEATKQFLSMEGNSNVNRAPTWSSIGSNDLPLATANNIGGVKIGANINLVETGADAGKISVNVATKKVGNTSGTLGLVKIGDNINLITSGDDAGEISVNVATKKIGNTLGTLGLVSIGDNINIASGGEISVPVATTSVNGVITTEGQSFNGIKKFISGSGIYSNEPNSKLSFYRNNKESCFVNSCRYALSNNYFSGQMSFGNYSYNSTGELLDYAEIYNLPRTQRGLTTNETYDILTTKTSKNVSVAPPDTDNNNELPGIKLHFGSTATTATASVTGVTASNTVIVSPVATIAEEETVSSWEIWRDAGIRCSGQADGQLSFTADETPAADTYFNVIILD